MTNNPEPKRSEDHEFPLIELFSPEDATQNPSAPIEDSDPTSESDAPAP